MSDLTNRGPSRREVLRTAGAVAAASALAGISIPHVHAAEDSTVRLALVGCGGRGTGAAGNAMSAKAAPTRLVAMADVFEERLNSSRDNLKKSFADKMDVPADRQFIGFDAYQKAMDCLRPGDIVLLTTPPAFRWVHFTYAIQKGLNVFMEKPVAVDGPTAKRMIKLGGGAAAKNLKVGVGLMCRHCAVRKELYQRIRDGEIGEITLLRAYRVKGPEAMEFSLPRPNDISELLYQIKRFHSFLWASGGCYSDFLIHNIDECCWMKDAWPVEARALGGRQYRGNYIDQNFDHYSVEYTFPDGTKLMLEGRNMPNCWSAFASYAHGTKGSAIISAESHTPAYSRIFKGQHIPFGKPRGGAADIVWKGPAQEPDPYQLEWEDLLTALQQDKPYNEVERGAMASLVTAMGRMSAHTGQVITQDQILNSGPEFAPDVDKLTYDAPAPVQAGADGKYPVPEPGRKKLQEY